MKHKISPWITIQRNLVDASCELCNNSIPAKEVFIIFEFNPPVKRMIGSFVHINCVNDLLHKQHWSHYKQSITKVREVDDVSKKYLCSYCNEHTKNKLLVFYGFCIHPTCIPNLMRDVDKLIPEIIAENI